MTPTYCGRNHTRKRHERGEIRNVVITGRIEVVVSIACKTTLFNIKTKAEVIRNTLNPEYETLNFD